MYIYMDETTNSYKNKVAKIYRNIKIAILTNSEYDKNYYNTYKDIIKDLEKIKFSPKNNEYYIETNSGQLPLFNNVFNDLTAYSDNLMKRYGNIFTINLDNGVRLTIFFKYIVAKNEDLWKDK